MQRSASLPLACLALGVLAACAPDGRARPSLELTGFDQAEHDDVYLNETLVFHFSDELERGSVTRASVRILGPDQKQVKGRFEVKRRRLLFHPELPLSSDLSDGGFQPDRAYTVELAGYPRPDGLRSRDGSYLSLSWSGSFRTVSQGGGRLFELVSDAQPFLRGPVEQRISPLDPILFTCDEPVDPTTLVAEDFELRVFQGDDLRSIPLRASLVSNTPDEARIHLQPLGSEGRGAALRALDPGVYYLGIPPGRLRLSNLGGRIVQPLGAHTSVSIEVFRSPVGVQLEEFDDLMQRSPQPALDAEASAHWSGDGWVRVRYPGAAGDGRHGKGDDLKSLFEDLTGDVDVHASRLEIQEGETVDLSAARGLVVLRSLASIDVNGTLRRTVRDAPPSLRNDFDALQRAIDDASDEVTRRTRALAEAEEGVDRGALEEGLREALALQKETGTKMVLTPWLEYARASGHDWTVLIAGGELRVAGRIEVDGPLLLIAGGRVRVSGFVVAPEVYRTRPGGGNFASSTWELETDLELDPPVGANPLRETLHLAIQSAPIRPPRGVDRWRPARVVGRRGSGDYRVRFFGIRDVGQRGTQVYGPVEDMALLDGCGAVSFVIELFVPPATEAEAWDPPSVDSVEVSWYEPLGGER